MITIKEVKKWEIEKRKVTALYLVQDLPKILHLRDEILTKTFSIFEVYKTLENPWHSKTSSTSLILSLSIFQTVKVLKQKWTNYLKSNNKCHHLMSELSPRRWSESTVCCGWAYWKEMDEKVPRKGRAWKQNLTLEKTKCISN